MAFLGTHHIAIKSPHFDEMKTFYSDVLGFPIVGQIPGSPTTFIDIGGTTIELGMTSDAIEAPPKVGMVHLAFEVDDVDATYEELVAKGVEFHVLPGDATGLRMAFFRDPDGNALELFQSPTLTWR